ncbi:plasmid pRiA4b ORF-3 family protein [Bacillus cereus]|uniref:Plasmid pRiA4b ORF-3-like protein n=1 Tax=Bacillus mobilis TaxID=2026190 RepID=A0A1Y5ZNZ1_9BACI|nr:MULTISPECIES: plasmid pRiA4b ORF-3 family protein [Bacillus cereus group]MBL3741301.1 plasmid pRiA4b ORF-3 family protein [Bacillus cereus]MBL3864139.1 plasmid pRiA4b ORF-3 family protein [Bacillus cereus]SME06051.1 Plasmid pRiA4b ORF-3-like protein [Bacillus mobilis]HDR6770982.1 plasmid pRiA4b ORF-3 family protein [Bacillus cereus]
MKYYQLHLELVGCPFPIWRKVILPAKLTFDDLHDVIQCLFQWEHQYLFEFTVGKYAISASPDSSISFAMLEQTTPSRMLRTDRTMLFEQIKKKHQIFQYVYDFGDYWLLQIQVEDIFEQNFDEITCTGGENAAPLEDIGGIPGYLEFLEVIKDSSHPQHKMYAEWDLLNFDPSFFDIQEVNKGLAYCD